MRQQKHWIKSFGATLLLSLLCLCNAGPTLAAGAIQALAQSYPTSTTIASGLIVTNDTAHAGRVKAADFASANSLLGVAVNAQSAPVTVSTPSSKTNQVYVASSGQYEVQVSNQNGVINVGDYISLSSITGIGMHASAQSEVLGRAMAAFDGRHHVIKKQTGRDQTGRRLTVAVTEIPVAIAIGPNPAAIKDGNYVPQFLVRATGLVTNKPLSTWQIYLSVLVLLVTVISGVSLLYGAVHSSMISIGRNPLARNSIMQNLVQIIIISIIIIVGGLFAAYAVLKV